MLLVHPVEHRQAERLRVDQLGCCAVGCESPDKPLGEPDTLPVPAVGAIEDQDAVAHRRRSTMDMMVRLNKRRFLLHDGMLLRADTGSTSAWLTPIKSSYAVP